MRALVALLALAVLAAAPPAPAAEKDVKKIPYCQYCGMDRERLGSTRVLIEYEGGTEIGTCSIHCAAVDLAQGFKKTIKSIRVADFATGKLADAAKAVWVVGAGIPGVMAEKSRVAFSDREDAVAFQKKFGGELADFDAALGSTFCDMPSDLGSVREWRSRRAGGGAR